MTSKKSDEEEKKDGRIYRKEDLVWEAVRRNEAYKAAFRLTLEKDNSIVSSTFKGAMCLIFETNILLDPSIKIDDIEEKITSGKNPFDVHPYYDYFKSGTKPALHHIMPAEIYRHRWDLLEDSSSEKVEAMFDKYLKLNNRLFQETENRIIISIDPLASDNAISQEIKQN